VFAHILFAKTAPQHDSVLIVDFKEFAGASAKKLSPKNENANKSVIFESHTTGLHNRWSTHPKWKITTSIKKGDILAIQVECRLLKSSINHRGIIYLLFRTAKKPHRNSLFTKIFPDTSWGTYAIPFQAQSDANANEAIAALGLGAAKQTIELRALNVWKYSAGKTLESFNYDPFHGRTNDSWRDAALDRIDSLRKADILVTVSDSGGKPLKGAKVSIALKSHAFGFGGHFQFHILRFKKDRPRDYAHYLRMFSEHFNCATIGWGPVWRDWQENGRFNAIYAKAAAWLNSKNMPITALSNALIQNIPRFYPQKVFSSMRNNNYKKYLGYSTKYLKSRISQLNAYKIDHWIGANEYVDSPFFSKQHADIMYHHFTLLDSMAPNATLGILEHYIIGRRNAKYESIYEKNIRDLIAKGVHLSRIGFQGHFDQMLTPPDTLLAVFDRFARFGIPLQVHEFDISGIHDSNLLRTYTLDFLIACFSHPAMREIYMWTPWSHIPRDDHKALFRHDWSLSPMGEAYNSLVFDRWFTKEKGATDIKGKYSTRGFMGEYQISAIRGSDTLTMNKPLTSDGLAVRFTFSSPQK